MEIFLGDSNRLLMPKDTVQRNLADRPQNLAKMFQFL